VIKDINVLPTCKANACVHSLFDKLVHTVEKKLAGNVCLVVFYRGVGRCISCPRMATRCIRRTAPRPTCVTPAPTVSGNIHNTGGQNINTIVANQTCAFQWLHYKKLKIFLLTVD